MIVFLQGKIKTLHPTSVWVDSNGVGYEVLISLKTFEKIKSLQEIFLYTFLQIREDAHTLFGFFDEPEVRVFKLLIQINGISGNTARMILSSLTPVEIVKAIQAQDSRIFKSVKGIGTKIAERIVLELKSKLDTVSDIVQDEPMNASSINVSSLHANIYLREAVQALQSLGIHKSQAESVCTKIAPTLNVDDSVETIIKLALQHL